MSLNVLITAGSRHVPLVRAFQRALHATGGGRVIVTDVNPLSPAVYVADRSYLAPASTDAEYLCTISEICRIEHVGLIVPTIDDELSAFARHAPRFADKGIRVVVSPPATTDACNDKHATSVLLAEAGVAAARTLLPAELPLDPTFPLFIKSRIGRSRVGAFPVRSARELEFFLDYVPDPIVQSYLDGREFTIDLLCDLTGRPLSIVPRERVVVRRGGDDRGRTVGDRRLIDLALACASVFTFIGPVNIQCRLMDQRPVVFEINARFSDGIPLTIEAGADFPGMLVELARGGDVRPRIGQFQDDLWMANYESSVFVPAAHLGFSSTIDSAEVA